jgi:hypothetical protein
VNGSNPGLETGGYAEVFVVFLRPSKKMLEFSLK